MKTNNEIREKAKLAGVKHWQIALHIGISEQTLVRWLRTPLTIENEEKIMGAINEISVQNMRVS